MSQNFDSKQEKKSLKTVHQLLINYLPHNDSMGPADKVARPSSTCFGDNLFWQNLFAAQTS